MPLSKSRLIDAFTCGAAVGSLGGLIGLGGAEFRLPLLIRAFGFPALQAVVLNKVLSLVVVASALPFRADAVPWDSVAASWFIVVNILAGSLVGAWVGAGIATRLQAGTLRRTIAMLLVAMALLLLLSPVATTFRPAMDNWFLTVTGVFAGLVIGSIAAFLGVAGGELIIPTLVILFGLEVTLAGSLSLVISLPTMAVGLARYSQDNSFRVIKDHGRFTLAMAAGSVVGTYIGGRMLNIIPHSFLIPLLAVILGISAIKLWNHSAESVGAKLVPKHPDTP
ncbi:MAG: sulfite exporter TauE/SafE family protein [Nitrospira sp. LK70]|nr:sulfite exporter TauE/SafE family protein [Nitrospira sp. LK70]